MAETVDGINADMGTLMHMPLTSCQVQLPLRFEVTNAPFSTLAYLK